MGRTPTFTLQVLDNCTEPMLSTTHMLSLAQDGIPPEILCRIFVFCSSEFTCTLPPKVIEPPWVMGQVCRKWREVSRSIRSIWKTRIRVYTIVTFADNFPIYDFDSRGFRHLERGRDLLPAGSYIALYIVPTLAGMLKSFDPIPSSAVVQLLPLIDELTWSINFNPAIFPAGSLANIEHLSIWPHINPDNDVAALSPIQFGPSPRLQTLHITTLTPRFLSSGIPLSRLRSLTLDALLFPTISLEVESAWRSFFMSKSTDFHCLQELTVASPSKLVDVILEANLFWDQLTSLNISVMDSINTLSLLLDRLRLSTRITHLRITHGQSASQRMPYHDEHPLTLPFLQTLALGNQIPLPMMEHLTSSSVLRSLDLPRISLSDLYSVLRQCPHLTNLIFSITSSTETHVSSWLNAIVLPCLTDLEISFDISSDQEREWSSALFPTLLTTPNLLSLDIHVDGPGTFPLDLTIDLIKRSDARLISIDLYIVEPTSWEPLESLLSLFNIVDFAHTVDVGNLICPQTVFDSFAVGELLPRVKSLTLSTSSLKQTVSAINDRLQHEESCKNVILRKITCYIYAGYSTAKPSNNSDDNSDNGNDDNSDNGSDDNNDNHSDGGSDNSDDGLDSETILIAATEIQERYGIDCEFHL
ncbi:hypothetical protein H0H93_011923 [Arthromyces matolae]|nr:hypothetical protein H0H93_011923 [Arthromyces matolae]